MLDQSRLRHWRSLYSLWHARRRCRRESRPRKIRREAAARGPRASLSATSAASRSAASASSRARSSAAGPRSSASATPRSPARIDQVPGRQESRRRADLAGRRRPCAADPASDPDDRRAGQSLLRLCGDQPHRLPPGQAARPPRHGRNGPQLRPVPKELGEGLREIADPELRGVWSRLRSKLPLAAARRRSTEGDDPIPVINRSE